MPYERLNSLIKCIHKPRRDKILTIFEFKSMSDLRVFAVKKYINFVNQIIACDV